MQRSRLEKLNEQSTTKKKIHLIAFANLKIFTLSKREQSGGKLYDCPRTLRPKGSTNFTIICRDESSLRRGSELCSLTHEHQAPCAEFARGHSETQWMSEWLQRGGERKG